MTGDHSATSLNRLKMFTVTKMDPAPEDVHVPAVMGSKKPKRKPRMEEIQSDPQATVIKVDESLGIVFGWAITSNIDGEPHFDSQGDHIPESVMLKAASSFMNDLRVGREMHVGDQKGTIVFAWPVTGDIAKAMGIESNMTGLMIGFKPDDAALLQKYRDGDYTGFSIGGKAARYEVVKENDDGEE